MIYEISHLWNQGDPGSKQEMTWNHFKGSILGEYLLSLNLLYVGKENNKLRGAEEFTGRTSYNTALEVEKIWMELILLP